MRLVTWNVNSISARMPRVRELLAAEQPDVVCLQETRVAAEAFPHLELLEAGYTAVVHGTSSRNGVAVLARDGLGLTAAASGLPGEPDAGEARWVEADVAGLRVASVYVPNGQAVDAPAFDDKLAFLDRLAERAAKLVAGGPTVIAGDVNVCATDVDAWDVTALHGGTHATDVERERLAAIVDAGLVDAYRAVRPADGSDAFTWFDYRGGAYHRREGLRIDQVLVTPDVGARVSDAWVARPYRKGSKPSDHAPVIVEVADEAPAPRPR